MDSQHAPLLCLNRSCNLYLWPLEFLSAHSCSPIFLFIKLQRMGAFPGVGGVSILDSGSEMWFVFISCFRLRHFSPDSCSELGLRKGNGERAVARMSRLSWSCSPAAQGVRRPCASAVLCAPANARAPGACGSPFPWRLFFFLFCFFYVLNR